MKLGQYMALCVVVVSACGNSGESDEVGSTSDSTAATRDTSAGASDPVPEPSADGIISGIVTLSPSTKSAHLSDLCVVNDRSFSSDDSEDLSETTAFAVFTRDGEEIARVPFLASQLIGGSLEFGPVAGFFGDPPHPGSRDALTLPLVEGDLVIEIEGTAVSPLIAKNAIATLPQCTGTGEG